MENKTLAEDTTGKPADKFLQLQEPCGANWQLFTNGAIGKLKCRICGVYCINGGTPKCLKGKGEGE